MVDAPTGVIQSTYIGAYGDGEQAAIQTMLRRVEKVNDHKELTTGIVVVGDRAYTHVPNPVEAERKESDKVADVLAQSDAVGGYMGTVKTHSGKFVRVYV